MSKRQRHKDKLARRDLHERELRETHQKQRETRARKAAIAIANMRNLRIPT